jgi:hypothetical protein
VPYSHLPFQLQKVFAGVYFIKPSRILNKFDFAVHGGNACGVVAAVLELAQARKYHFGRFPKTNVADYAAHENSRP